jgi:hypothetical protein
VLLDIFYKEAEVLSPVTGVMVLFLGANIPATHARKL